VSDAVILIRDMAADASQKAANVVRPPEEQLAQIDEPAEENTWHEKPNISKEDVKQRLKKKGVSHSSLAAKIDYKLTSIAGQGQLYRSFHPGDRWW
jgi:hypothetical protein